MALRACICSLVVSVVLHTDHSFTAQAALYTPPNILEPSTAKLDYIPAGTDVMLNCTAEGTAPIKFKWKKDWVDITNDGIFTVDENSGLLTIKTFTLREEGQYQCVAQNPAPQGIPAVSVSPVITLRQEQLATKWPDTPKETVEGTVGGYVALQCTNIPDSVPKPRFSWFIQSSDGKKEQLKLDERKYIDNTGTLHFVDLKMDDQQASVNTEYKCAIYNTKDAFLLGSPKSLVVMSGTVAQQQKPANMFHTNYVPFLRTKSAELECVFRGNPVPTIKWFRRGTEIVNSNKYEIDVTTYFYRKLVVKDLKYSDEGEYICRGSNTLGTVDTAVYLDVTSGPIWERGLVSQTLPEGTSARFTCQARSSPDENLLPEPVWFKNGKQMIGIPVGNMEFSERGTVLTLRAISKPVDIMCFQCNVSNSNGFEFDSDCLNVIKPIDVKQSPPLIQEIHKGDTVDLTVIATTDPDLILKDLWYFRNITYDSSLPPHVVRNDVSKTYYINTSSLTDEEFNAIQGVYYREFYHQYEKKNVTTDVTTKGPIPGAVTQAAFPLWVIAVVIVLILLILLLTLIILCCCRNKEQGAYRIYKTELNTAYLDPDKDIEKNKFQDVARIDVEEDLDGLDQYRGGKPPRHSFTEDASLIGEYASRESQDF